ncbi:MAG: hypothetical protein CMP81_17370 [Fulvimarina sp.]|nr:hypothetical protein [Fulvimarina sp.]
MPVDAGSRVSHPRRASPAAPAIDRRPKDRPLCATSTPRLQRGLRPGATHRGQVVRLWRFHCEGASHARQRITPMAPLVQIAFAKRYLVTLPAPRRP